IYFISDRDGRMNLFATDLTTKETKQLTTFKDFDIKFPSIGKDSIVFEEAGYIWRYDLAGGQAAPIPIEVKEDFASGRPASSMPRSTSNRSISRLMANAPLWWRAAIFSPCR